MELEGYSRPTYNKLMYSAMTRSTVVGVIHTLTVDELITRFTPIHRRLAVAKFSKSKMQKLPTWPWPRPFAGWLVVSRLGLASINLQTKFEVCRCTRYEAIWMAVQNEQVAQLSPRDRAMRRVSWNLANCHATVQTLLVRIEQIEVMKSEGYCGTMCNKHVHSTMTRSSRFHCPIGVINKMTTDELWISVDVEVVF